MNHLSEEELILLHYGEDSGRKDAANHLETCAQCRAEFQSLHNVLAVVSKAPTPARNENFGAEIWRQVGPTITNEMLDRTRSRIAWWPKLGFAMAAIVVAAFVVSRLSTMPKQTAVSIPAKPIESADGSTRILLNEIGDHLERSQIALIDLLNSKTEGPVDLSSEKILARELVAMNRLFRRASTQSGETAAATVLDELERALVEVANSPTNLNAEEFAELRQRVGGDSLIFKVRIVAQQLRSREKSLLQQNTRRS